VRPARRFADDLLEPSPPGRSSKWKALAGGDSPGDPRRLPTGLVLPALLLAAWLLFELTANATLSVLLACLKFGWEDFRTAWWLYRVDPVRRRALACSWFYLASGIWKTAVMPILVVMIVSALWAMMGPRAQLPDEVVTQQVVSAIVVGVVAASALVGVVAIAVSLTLATGVRVWVHHQLHESRRRQRWPPHWDETLWQHDNRGRAVLATALVFATIGLPPWLFRSVVHLGPLPEVIAVLAIVFGVPILATTLYALLRERLFAHSPAECWPPVEGLPASGEPAASQRRVSPGDLPTLQGPVIAKESGRADV
jgi:hypothetical protein